MVERGEATFEAKLVIGCRGPEEFRKTRRAFDTSHPHMACTGMISANIKDYSKYREMMDSFLCEEKAVAQGYKDKADEATLRGAWRRPRGDTQRR
jgi:hypothetical protein